MVRFEFKEIKRERVTLPRNFRQRLGQWLSLSSEWPRYVSFERTFWRVLRVIAKSAKAVITTAILFAFFTLAESLQIVPGGSSYAVLLLTAASLGLFASTMKDSFVGGFAGGYLGAFVGYPISALAQYASNPDIGPIGWLLVPVVGFVAAAFFGILPATLGGGSCLLGCVVGSKFRSWSYH